MEELMEKKMGTFKIAVWLGWVLTALPVLMFSMSAIMKFTASQKILDLMSQLGWQPSTLIPLGILEISCVLLYLVPRVSVLGAILFTGYVGGAIATEVRLAQPVYLHIALGVFIWGGLYLREPRLRALLPLKSRA
jgi:hypothetical protein